MKGGKRGREGRERENEQAEGHQPFHFSFGCEDAENGLKKRREKKPRSVKSSKQTEQKIETGDATHNEDRDRKCDDGEDELGSSSSSLTFEKGGN